MTRTNGEHELVFGNKQLLSAFFVVVILLGVFFTMGYFVGKNTATAGFNSGQALSGGGTRPDAAGKPLDNGAVTGSLPPDGTSPVVDPNAPSTPLPTTPAPPATAAVTPPADTQKRHEGAKKADADFPIDAPPAKTETAKPSGEEMYLQVSRSAGPTPITSPRS